MRAATLHLPAARAQPRAVEEPQLIRLRQQLPQLHHVPLVRCWRHQAAQLLDPFLELVTHLRFAGFRFYALPHAFVTHMPHVKSLQKAQWEAGAHRKEMDRLYQKLVAQLISRYNRPRTPSCHPGRLL